MIFQMIPNTWHFDQYENDFLQEIIHALKTDNVPTISYITVKPLQNGPPTNWNPLLTEHLDSHQHIYLYI